MAKMDEALYEGMDDAAYRRMAHWSAKGACMMMNTVRYSAEALSEEIPCPIARGHCP